MRMSNYLRVATLPLPEMAAKSPKFGMDHPTTVPTNFVPTPDDDEDPEDSEE